MPNYSTFAITVRGYSHIRKEIPGEDYSSHKNGENYHIAIISDGHGDKKCFRSSKGSQIAVEIAEKSLIEFSETIRSISSSQDVSQQTILNNNKERSSRLRHLCKNIIGNWGQQISEDLQNNPPTPDEISGAGISPDWLDDPENRSYVYGATLIAVLITDDYLIVIQQGDGRCVIIHDDGSVDQPVPWDDRCVLNVTTSMCDYDASESCRFYYSDQHTKPVIACFAASDGVEDSYETLEEVNSFFMDLTVKYFEMGHDSFIDYLENLLPDLSRFGSHDDVSIAGIIDAEAVKPYLDQYRLLIEYNNCKFNADKIQEKIDSMYMKLGILKKRYEAADQKVKNTSIEINNISQEVISILAKLRKKNEEEENKKKEQTDDQIAFEKAKREYESYRDENQEYIKKLEEINKEMDNIKSQIESLRNKKDADQFEPDAEADKLEENVSDPSNEKDAEDLEKIEQSDL